MLDSEELKSTLKKKIHTEEDFVFSEKDANSLKKVLEKEEELNNRKIAKLLMMKEKEVETLYDNIVEKMKKILGRMNK